MNARDVMTPRPVRCLSDVSLIDAGKLMRDEEIGFLPIVDRADHLIGILTDRDLAIALCTRNVKPSELTVGDIAKPRIRTCEPGDDIQIVLGEMRRSKLHRVPIVDDAGILKGVVSFDDVVMFIGSELPPEDVIETMQSISSHRSSHPVAVAAF
jgi:CBS domain-containing protein